MAKMMENLINNKYYSTKDETLNKLNVFFALNVITQEEYTDLMRLTDSVYVDAIVSE